VFNGAIHADILDFGARVFATLAQMAEELRNVGACIYTICGPPGEGGIATWGLVRVELEVTLRIQWSLAESPVRKGIGDWPPWHKNRGAATTPHAPHAFGRAIESDRVCNKRL
jgi:hypothetical protein